MKKCVYFYEKICQSLRECVHLRNVKSICLKTVSLKLRQILSKKEKVIFNAMFYESFTL